METDDMVSQMKRLRLWDYLCRACFLVAILVPFILVFTGHWPLTQGHTGSYVVSVVMLFFGIGSVIFGSKADRLELRIERENPSPSNGGE